MSTTIEIAGELNRIYDTKLTNDLVASLNYDDTYITPIEVLCVTCKQPIKGWVNSPQWLRVEWISSSGECRACDQQAKESDNGTVK